jgi:hypothetical protein
MFIPYSIIISPSVARKSEIGQIFSANPYWFTGHAYAEFDTLVVYLIYERHKGVASKWYSYFEAISDTELLCDWSEQDLFQLQDPLLLLHAKEFSNQIEKTWTSLQQIFQEHSDVFPEGQDLKDLYNWSWRVVSTRSFQHDELRLIPMADFINYSNAEVVYEDHDIEILTRNANHNSGPIDYREFLGHSIKGSGSMDDVRYKNRLDEYLNSNPAKESLKQINAIWEINKFLTDFESSEDEEDVYIVDLKSDEEDEAEAEEEDQEINGQDYIVLHTGPKSPVKQGFQVFQQPRKLSNRDWLLQFGFCYENNKFDSYYLLFWSPSFNRNGLITIEEIENKVYQSDINAACLSDVTELIQLKDDKFNMEILKYYRKTLNYASAHLPEPALKASPSDLDVELYIIEKVLELYGKLEENKSPLSHDVNLLNRTLPKRLKYALVYRISQKKIINSQKNFLVLLRTILTKVKEGEKLEKHMTEKTIKSIKIVYPLMKYLKSLRGNMTKIL